MVVFTGPSETIKHTNRSTEQISTVPPSYLLLKSIGTKFNEIRGEIKLSTSSLNSNSSGSSSNSSESNNKNGLVPARTEETWEAKPWLNGSENSLNVTSTPSESTSELSVLSSNTLVSPVNMPFLNKKASALQSRGMKLSTSTGAIPKSISFDMSAEKGDKNLDDDSRSKRGSFFGKLRMGFRNRRGKSFREEYNNVRFECDDDARGRRSEYSSRSPVTSALNNAGNKLVNDLFVLFVER